MLYQSISLIFIILYTSSKVGTTLAFRTLDLILTKGSSKLPSLFTVSPREDQIPSFPKGLRGGREPSFPKRTVHMDQITVYLFIAIVFGLGFLVRISREISNQLKELFDIGGSFHQTGKGTTQAADIRR